MGREKSYILEPFSKAADEEKQNAARLFPSYRLAISVLSFCGLFLSAQSQSSMGAVLVCMVTNDSHNDTFETFGWDKTTQGWILGIRFLAFYLAQLPSGYLTSYINNKVMATIGLVALGTFDILVVPCAKHSVALLLVARVGQGFANAFASTGSYDILGKWIPSHELSVLLGIAGIGFFAGSFPMFLISSVVCDNPMLGWPCVFYITGGASLVFSIFWYIFADNEPTVSRWIGQDEKEYVMAYKNDEVVCRNIPWRAMLTSGPIYAIVCAQVALEWLQYLSLTVAPGFFTDILQLSQAQADLICGVPYLLAIPVCTLFGRFLDTLRDHRLLSTANVRRVAQFVGSLVPAACCVVLAVLPASNVAGAVAAFSVCVVAFTCTTSGWVANVSDLAPQQGGATFTFCQTLAAWVSFVVPILVEYLTAHKTKEEWDTVFYITVGLQLVCFVGFCGLVSGDIQPWAKSDEERLSLTSHETVRSYAPN